MVQYHRTSDTRRILLPVVMALLGLILAVSGGASAAASSCAPQPNLLDCAASVRSECDGVLRKAFSAGCRANGKKLRDGGCQCTGYCGYQCAAACNADSECGWNTAKKKCFNKETGLAGRPIKTCTTTRTPTKAPSSNPSKAPTTPTTVAPTFAPTRAPLSPTYRPTNVYTQAPSKFQCHEDKAFPGTMEDGNTTHFETIRLAMTPDAATVVYTSAGASPTASPVVYSRALWVTKKQASTGTWKPQRVMEFLDSDDDYVYVFPGVASASISSDSKYLMAVVANEPSSNVTFFQLNAQTNKYVKQAVLNFTLGGNIRTWMHPSGIRALVSYEVIHDDEDDYHQTTTYHTINFIRSNNAIWTVEWTQEIYLHSVSGDGTTALSLTRGDDNSEGEQDRNSDEVFTARRVLIRQGKQWVVQASDLVGRELPLPQYQGSDFSSFTADGNTLVLGTLSDGWSGDDLPSIPFPESGAYVFIRSSNGKWTQKGSKLGGGDRHSDGWYTGVSNDGKTIVMSTYYNEVSNAIKVFSLTSPSATWVQTAFLPTPSNDFIASANAKYLLTSYPVTLWVC